MGSLRTSCDVSWVVCSPDYHALLSVSFAEPTSCSHRVLGRKQRACVAQVEKSYPLHLFLQQSVRCVEYHLDWWAANARASTDNFHVGFGAYRVIPKRESVSHCCYSFYLHLSCQLCHVQGVFLVQQQTE